MDNPTLTLKAQFTPQESLRLQQDRHGHRLSHTDWRFAALRILAITSYHLTPRLCCMKRASAPVTKHRLQSQALQGSGRVARSLPWAPQQAWTLAGAEVGAPCYLNHPPHITQTHPSHAHSVTSVHDHWIHAGLWSSRFHNMVFGQGAGITPQQHLLKAEGTIVTQQETLLGQLHPVPSFTEDAST